MSRRSQYHKMMPFHLGTWPRLVWLYTLTLTLLCALLLAPLHLSDVEQMAIDWLTGNFYFVDDVDDRVFVCNKNGQTCVTLLDQELYNPKGIALDPAMGSVLPSSPSWPNATLSAVLATLERKKPSYDQATCWQSRQSEIEALLPDGKKDRYWCAT